MNIKKSIFRIISVDDGRNIKSQIFDIFISLLILLSVLAIVLESFDHLTARYGKQFRYFEVFAVVIFTIEYVLRFWTSDLLYPDSQDKVRSSVKYFFSLSGLIDLLATLPFCLSLVAPITGDFRFLRTGRLLRSLRLLRILKLSKYSKSLGLLGEIITEKKSDLLAAFMFTFVLTIMAASLMYSVEHEVQPDKFPNIIETCWWAVITLTTIGYGEVTPKTGLGKIIGGLVSVLCVGLVALPTAILSAGMIEKLHRTKNSENTLIEEDRNIELDSLRQEISDKIEAIDEKLNELIKKIES